MRNMTVKLLTFLFIIGLLVQACTPIPRVAGQALPSSNQSPTQASAGTQPENTQPQADETPGIVSLDSTDANVTPAPGTENATAMPGVLTRQPPADLDWRAAPIQPEMPDNIIAIYQHGLALGRNPQNFSVIGDCQAIPFVFMGPIGRQEVMPGNSEQHLWNAISYFDSSFKHESITVRGGFTAASILNPTQADPKECKPGETPLTCEYRLNNPAFVIIALETWLDPNTVSRYETYLRKILQTVIERGSVPILLTKADSSEVKDGTHVINPAIVKIAYEYDVPVINFWRAAQNLPNYGIDPDREGFHLSPEGYKLKNLLVLRALYAAWEKVSEQDSSATINIGNTPTPTSQESAAPDTGIELLSPASCPGGCIFFGLAESHDGQVDTGGVFAFDPENRKLIQILPDGFNLQDTSPDGKRLLINRQNFLYAINLGNSSSQLVTEKLYWQGEQSAYWAGPQGSEIVFIDSQNPMRGGTGQAIRLFPSGRSETIFFESGSCDSKDHCLGEGIFQQRPGQPAQPLPDTLRPLFSPDGNWYIFLNAKAATPENYGHIHYFLLQDPQRGEASRRVFYLPQRRGFMVFPDVRAYAFSPQGDKVFIFYDIYSAYYEKSLRFETYLLDIKSGWMEEYGKMTGGSGSLRPQIVWSPDGAKVFLFLTEKDAEDNYHLDVYEIMLNGNKELGLYAERIFTNPNYFYATNIHWQTP